MQLFKRMSNYINGFIKRAQQCGLSQEQALSVYKQANGIEALEASTPWTEPAHEAVEAADNGLQAAEYGVKAKNFLGIPQFGGAVGRTASKLLHGASRFAAPITTMETILDAGNYMHNPAESIRKYDQYWNDHPVSGWAAPGNVFLRGMNAMSHIPTALAATNFNPDPRSAFGYGRGARDQVFEDERATQQLHQTTSDWRKSMNNMLEQSRAVANSPEYQQHLKETDASHQTPLAPFEFELKSMGLSC